MRTNRKSGSGSGPFLMEMLVVVGFFIACASICVLVFVKADNISQEARDMNQAVLAAESLAEELKLWKAGVIAQGQGTKILAYGPAEGQESMGSEMLPDRNIWKYLAAADDGMDEQEASWLEALEKSEGYEGMFTLYWDSRWKPTEPQAAPPYLGIVRAGTVDHMRRADILIMCYGKDGNKGKVLYRLQTETYEKP